VVELVEHFQMEQELTEQLILVEAEVVDLQHLDHQQEQVVTVVRESLS
jgi:hypothetical protein